MTSGIGRFVLCVVSSFAFCLGGFAQSDIARATLNGTVTEPTGAIVSVAKITVADPQTGFTRESVTTDAGLYSFTGLPVGTYDVTVETSGFKTTRKAGIRLAVGAVA